MPRKKTWTKRKRRYRGRRKRRAFSGRPSNMPGFPTTKIVKHRYCDTISLDPGFGPTPAVHAFHANDLFDPDYTTSSGGDHQPLGFDQWAQFYNHYCVIGALITVQIMPTSNSSVPLLAGVYLSDDAVVPTDVTTLIEQGLGVYRMMGPVTNSPGIQRPMRIGYSAKKFFSITDVKDNIARIGALAVTSGGPSDKAFFNVWAASSSSGSDPNPLSALITIDYVTLWSEPKSIPQSDA